jgi:hypothetical protein
MRLFLLLVLSVNLFLLSSCKKYKPAGEAFFIRASKVSLAVTKGQGSANHKITDLWLYVNGKFQGVYPVGNIMPVPSNGQTARIEIFAGIKNNGISDTRIYWSFYELLRIDTLVENGKTIDRAFTFKYNANTTFTLNESFDDSGFTVRKSDISDTIFNVIASADSFEGKSIELGLTGSHKVAQIESSGDGFALPLGSGNVYLELNYKCTHEFVVGLLGNNNYEKPVITLNPTDEWNKIYIQLSTAVSSPPTSNKYKVYFRLLKKTSSDPKVFLDNIKLVYL